MWGEGDKVWLHYRKDILAADMPAAQFLATYLKHSSIKWLHVPCLEVADLQRYKLIKKERKVRQALIDRADIPFIFVVGKN